MKCTGSIGSIVSIVLTTIQFCDSTLCNKIIKRTRKKQPIFGYESRVKPSTLSRTLRFNAK